MTTVYASKGGHRYHASTDCRALESGRDFRDFDEPDDAYLYRWAYPVTHPVRETTALAALGDGKTPCRICFPGQHAALIRSSCEWDFGHQPITIDGDHFCRRCRTHGHNEDGEPWSYPTLWPCTSAVVLGLLPREVTA